MIRVRKKEKIKAKIKKIFYEFITLKKLSYLQESFYVLNIN